MAQLADPKIREKLQNDVMQEILYNFTPKDMRAYAALNEKMAKHAKNSTEALIKKKMGNWKGPIERVTSVAIPLLEGGEADTKGKMSKEVKAVFDKHEPFFDALEKQWDYVQEMPFFDGKIADGVQEDIPENSIAQRIRTVKQVDAEGKAHKDDIHGMRRFVYKDGIWEDCMMDGKREGIRRFVHQYGHWWEIWRNDKLRFRYQFDIDGKLTGQEVHNHEQQPKDEK